MTDIQTPDQLNTAIAQMATEAIKGITKEVLDLFKQEYLRKYVYSSPDSHDSNVLYHDKTGEPTYEFEKAWEWTEIKRQVNILSTEMWFNGSSMGFDKKTYKHGSKYSKPNDVRGTLMDILNKDGYSSSLWLSVSRKVAYWDRFISDMFDNGELGKIVEKHFLAQGFFK